MKSFRFASILLAAASSTLLATPSWAHMPPHISGGGGFHYGGGMNPRPMHMSGPSMGRSMGGCCGAGGHMSGGLSHMTYGGRPQPGMHPMGMHFYGMSGSGLMKKYGQISGGHSYGMWSGGHSYGMGGGHEMHAPLGSHMMGMHFYGMGGGSLAEKYGQLEHGNGAPAYLPVSSGGSQGYGPSYGRAPGPLPPKTWGAPVAHNPYGSSGPAGSQASGRHEKRHEDAMREAYRVKYVSRGSARYKVISKSGGYGAGHGGLHEHPLYAVR